MMYLNYYPKLEQPKMPKNCGSEGEVNSLLKLLMLRRFMRRYLNIQYRKNYLNVKRYGINEKKNINECI